MNERERIIDLEAKFDHLVADRDRLEAAIDRCVARVIRPDGKQAAPYEAYAAVEELRRASLSRAVGPEG